MVAVGAAAAVEPWMLSRKGMSEGLLGVKIPAWPVELMARTAAGPKEAFCRGTFPELQAGDRKVQ
jgi:hypothetical protein